MAFSFQNLKEQIYLHNDIDLLKNEDSAAHSVFPLSC